MIKQNMTHFIHTRKQKQLLMKMTLMMYLNQSIQQLYQAYKNFKEKVQAGLLIPRNAKEHCQSFLRKKKTKQLKQ